MQYMETPLAMFFDLFVVFFLVLGNFYFVAAEFAMVRSRPTRLRDPEELKKFGSASALQLIQDLDLSLSAIQLGITVVSLVLGWRGEHIFASIFLQLFALLGPTAAQLLSHGLATTLALLVVTVLHVVIGELAAKSLAIRHPEPTLRMLAPFMLFLAKVFRPIIFVLNGAANLFLSIFGLKTVAESERVLTSSELAMLVSHSSRYGMLDKREEEMLKGILLFSETVAREVMTPRTDMITIPHNASFPEVLRIVTQSGFSRFPVIGDRTDDIRGIVLARDMLMALQINLGKPPESFDVKKVMRKAYFIPGTKAIDDLLTELRARNVHLAVVLDEHGGVDGVVTLEDIIEEIVGEIFDESDRLEEDIVVQEDGDVLIDGGVLVSDINERLSLHITEGDYDTIAGFMFSALGRIAVASDSILIDRAGRVLEVNGIAPRVAGLSIPDDENHDESEESAEGESPLPHALLTVEQVLGNRISSIRLHAIKDTDGNPEPSAEPSISDVNEAIGSGAEAHSSVAGASASDVEPGKSGQDSNDSRLRKRLA